jgi:Ca2+-transporting ATPase
VRALQAAGERVAVTGDGVNDVPALQAADVGIAIGSRAVRSAREAAHIVLLDDDFGTLVRAIAEGRALAANLRRSFRYLVAVHVPLVVSAAVVPLLGWPLLFLPLHIVWLELLIHPTAMLVFQAGDRPASLAGDRAPAARAVLGAGDWIALGVSGVLLTAALLAGHARAATGAGDVAHARAMALAVLSFGSVAAMAALGGLRVGVGRVLGLLGVAGTAALVQLPASAAVHGLRPLHADDWALAAAAAVVAALPLGSGRLSGPRRSAPPPRPRPPGPGR